MKKNGILNAELSRIIAAMGHMDQIVICDAGLPIPHDARCVDLALKLNIPGFNETLETILSELQIEKAIVADEMYMQSKKVFKFVKEQLMDIPIEKVPHENFKNISQNGQNIVFVRTGEATPYANIILISGVTF